MSGITNITVNNGGTYYTEAPTVLISGFSLPSTEIFDDNVIRIFKGGGCTGCFNRHRLDAGDWNWCPRLKGTERMFECTTRITPDMVKSKIHELITGESL